MPPFRHAALAALVMTALPAFAQDLPAQDTPAQSPEIIAANQATNAYLSNRERGAHDVNWQALADELQAMVLRPDFRNTEEHHAERLGKLEAFTVLGARTLEEETLVALDYVARYRSGQAECGYYVWQVPDPTQAPRLMRLEATMFDPAIATTAEGKAKLVKAGCNLGN